MNKRMYRLALALAVVGALAGACGDDEGTALRCPSHLVKVDGFCETRNGGVDGQLVLAAAPNPAGATVTLLGTDRLATVGNDGAFRLREVPPGTYTLEARAPGHETVRHEGVAVVEREVTKLPSLALAALAAPELRGRVTLADAGDPTGTAVSVLESAAMVFAAADGSFRLPLFTPGTYTIVARLAGYAEARIEDVEVEGSVELAPFQLALATGGVTGQLRLAGAASGNAGIAVFLEGTGHLASTADDGGFSFARVEPGAHILVAMREGFATTRTAVAVTAGELANLGAIVLPPAAPSGAGDLSGTTRLLGRATHEGIAVRLEGPDFDRTVQTDAAGAFHFAEVPVGAYRLHYSYPAFRAEVFAGLVIERGAQTAPVVTLRRSVPVDERPLAWAGAAGPDHLLARFAGGIEPPTFSLAADGARTLLFPGEAAFLLASPDGNHALFDEFGRVVRADLRTGDRIPVAPQPAWILLPSAEGLWYVTADGGLWFLPPDAVDGIEVHSTGCASAYYWPMSVGALPRVRVENPCQGSYEELVLVARGATAVGPIHADHLLTAQAAILEVASADPAEGSRLVRIDLDSGAVTTVLEQVAQVVGKDRGWLAVLHTPAGTAGYRLSLVEPDAGTATGLIDDVSHFHGALGATAAVVFSSGPDAGLYRVRFDVPATDRACAGTAAAYLPTEDGGFYCTSTDAGVERLVWFDLATGTATTISNSASGIVPVGSGRTVRWRHPNGNAYAATRDGNFVPRLLGPADLQVVVAASADGTRLINFWLDTAFQARLEALDLITGSRTALLPGPQDYTQDPSLRCAMSPAGKTAFCFYRWSSPGPWACGANSCLAILDLDLGIERHLTAPSAPSALGSIVWSPDERSALMSSYGELFHLTRDTGGLPAVKRGTELGYDYRPVGIGNDGHHGLVARYSWGTTTYDHLRVDAGETAGEPLAAGAATAIDTATWLVGDELFDLSSGSARALGTGVHGVAVSPDRQAFLFRANPEGHLYRWTRDGGVTPIALRARPWTIGSERYWLVEDEKGKRDLLRVDPATGTKTVIVEGFHAALRELEGDRWLVVGAYDPDTRLGTLLAADLEGGAHPLASAVRATVDMPTVGDRLIFHALERGQPMVRAFSLASETVTTLGAGEARRIVAAPATGRILFESDGTWWAENPGGAAPTAVDFAEPGRLPVITDDGDFVLYDLANSGTFGLAL